MRKISQKIIQESRKFKKYWALRDYSKLTKEEVDNLIYLYYKFKDARNKCTAAIFLSHIDNDDRIPPILFDALKYWKDSGYSGWVVTSNGRIFNYYPKYRDKYLDLMFNGKVIERRILSSSLFFIQEKLRDISDENLLRIKRKFVRQEKNQDLRRHILWHLNLIEAMEFAKNLLVDYDPLDLIKQGAKLDIYESVFHEFVAPYKNNNQKRRRLKFIKSSFNREFGRAPSDKVLERILNHVTIKMHKKV